MSPTAIQQFCQNKLEKRLITLMLQAISFTGKTEVIKQVLLAMPTYHLMYIELSNTALSRIQRICTQFLWGHSKQGKRKTTLIAWERMIKYRKHGGLEIIDIRMQEKALRARWPVKLLTEPKSTWASIFKACLEKAPWAKKQIMNRLRYSI
jgi:hypothetical protein